HGRRDSGRRRRLQLRFGAGNSFLVDVHWRYAAAGHSVRDNRPADKAFGEGGGVALEKVYTPREGDFEFIGERDINVDKNFASQGYWKGVAIHFARDKFAMTGVI
ncbi:hypothetical protein DCD76_19005, partial [Acinetobacter baumannii]